MTPPSLPVSPSLSSLSLSFSLSLSIFLSHSLYLPHFLSLSLMYVCVLIDACIGDIIKVFMFGRISFAQSLHTTHTTPNTRTFSHIFSHWMLSPCSCSTHTVETYLLTNGEETLASRHFLLLAALHTVPYSSSLSLTHSLSLFLMVRSLFLLSVFLLCYCSIWQITLSLSLSQSHAHQAIANREKGKRRQVEQKTNNKKTKT